MSEEDITDLARIVAGRQLSPETLRSEGREEKGERSGPKASLFPHPHLLPEEPEDYRAPTLDPSITRQSGNELGVTAPGRGARKESV